jgi:hypothetical protein
MVYQKRFHASCVIKKMRSSIISPPNASSPYKFGLPSFHVCHGHHANWDKDVGKRNKNVNGSMFNLERSVFRIGPLSQRSTNRRPKEFTLLRNWCRTLQPANINRNLYQFSFVLVISRPQFFLTLFPFCSNQGL